MRASSAGQSMPASWARQSMPVEKRAWAAHCPMRGVSACSRCAASPGCALAAPTCASASPRCVSVAPPSATLLGATAWESWLSWPRGSLPPLSALRDDGRSGGPGSRFSTQPVGYVSPEPRRRAWWRGAWAHGAVTRRSFPGRRAQTAQTITETSRGGKAVLTPLWTEIDRSTRQGPGRCVADHDECPDYLRRCVNGE
jgi:hypothetical protein